ncbi:MAG: NAD(P)-dependent oxidoreductase [Clostridia bacterium]
MKRVFILDKSDNRIERLGSLMQMRGHKVLNADALISEDEKAIYIFAPNYLLKSQKLSSIPNNSIIYCGRSDFDYTLEISSRNIDVFEYSKDEEFSIKNADYTAEATLFLMLGLMDYQLVDAKVLIIGFGRCGRAMCKYLYNLRANLTIMTDKPYEAMLFGAATSYENENFGKYDVIINTAPRNVISDLQLEKLKKGVIVIDLASSPYGLNHIKARELGINSDIYPALPARFRVESATRAIFDFISKTQGEKL